HGAVSPSSRKNLERCCAGHAIFAQKQRYLGRQTRVVFARGSHNRSEFDGLYWEARQRRRQLRRGGTAIA
ncbi:unnamed protein product, partial [Ectocarpus sp. 12 AP-2014]